MGFRVLTAIVVTGALAVALWVGVAPFQVEEASNFPIAEVGQDEFVAVYDEGHNLLFFAFFNGFHLKLC